MLSQISRFDFLHMYFKDWNVASKLASKKQMLRVHSDQQVQPYLVTISVDLVTISV